jgi:hypothetical protein
VVGFTNGSRGKYKEKPMKRNDDDSVKILCNVLAEQIIV